ncbi:MAG: F0F1 ATP synthase subunit gamma, partial [Bacteroidota bacterium]
MPSLKEVKLRITSVSSTQQITKAMKMVAAAKLRRSQERITQIRPFAAKMNGLLRNLSSSAGDTAGWYSRTGEVKKVLMIVISSDRGLCGGFNTSVLKAAARRIQDAHAQAAVTVLPLGKKAYEFYAKRSQASVTD